MAEAHTTSYYAATQHPYTPFPELEGEIKADVVIIGGGFTGVNSAIELADRGFSVVLLEANRIGWGATGRNGGQITGSLSGDKAMAREFRRSLGSDTDDFIWNLRWRGHQIIRKRVNRFAIDCDLKQGHIQTACAPAHLPELRTMYAEAVRRGMADDVEFVEQDRIKEFVDSPIYLGGLVNRRNMHVHSLNLCLGEAQAAAKLGVQVYENSRVLRIEEGARPVVVTKSGRVTADKVLLAGNAYHRLGKRKMRGALFPAALGIVATAPLGKDVARTINPHDMAIYDNRFVLDYHRLTADNRLIFGGGTNYSGRPSSDIAAELRPSIERTFPQLKGVGIEFGWSGLAGIIVNRIPHLGRIAPNIFYAEGYSGHGIATTHIVAEIMAEAISGTMREFDVFAGVRHMRLPLGTWAGQQAIALGMFYYRLKERLR
ncbi:NAD(P)/FAD-dependent oxidoreductase [Paracoccus aestuariivivens]|uniref:FAD-dependent oxidoreductase n=1 Tax=Paracoccus aestuariivivens TaxID=1820333 RepID=A0A6L6JCT3_9RHOB|nr:FAD-binding oxidoreductase [Paracoccus aestuariivivens]MTH77964.1 FAD-dependent oxidoreductase [Paracoccus aestuariivivens]